VLRIPSAPNHALQSVREMASLVREGSHGAHERHGLRLAALPSGPKMLPAFSQSSARKQSSPDLISPTSRGSVMERSTSQVSDPELSFYAYRRTIDQSQTALI
jgi:hypothetical protein